MVRFLFAIVTVLVTSTLAQDFATYRLSNNTRPETYDLSVRTWIHEENATFTGSVRIGIVAVESTNFIRLHHDVQTLQSVTVLTADQVPITIGDYSYNAQYNFLTIPVIGNNLTEGTRYFVDIDYASFMTSYRGFYRSSYLLDTDERIWFASTHFEPTNARAAFPCYDEPALRANFTIRITHGASLFALSNMPSTSVTSNPDGSVTTLFATTPPISTYLVAFHVSAFPNVTSSTPRPTPQRVFSRSNAITLTNLTLSTGELLLDAISDYVGIEYTLPKMDQIAVPGFPSGAMENWGLITYDEFYALYNDSQDLFTRPLQGIQTVSHEISHMWFGNLVTPSWWTFLWMKEGFATFFEYYGIDLIYPEWQMLDFFVVDITQYVLRLDANPFAQPMSYYVEHPSDIGFQFGSIAYSKAGAVLRMFWYTLGEDVFMRGATSYLQANAFSDADEEDLFEALDLSVWLEPETIIPPSVDVATIMRTWTRQAGFPLITVERNYDSETERVTLRQERFYTNPPPNRENTTWWVPYNLMTPSNPGFENTRADGWIPQNTTALEITVDSLGADDYLLLNKRAAGYYRVIYDERNYRLISDAIIRNSSLFHTTNIAQLIQDAAEFYETGRLNITSILDLLRVLEFESDYVGWSPAFLFIDYITRNFRGHRNFPIWTDFVRSLTENLYDSVGVVDIQDEPYLRKFARESVVALACEMGSVHCRSDANRQLSLHIESGTEFHHNVRGILRCASMRSASRTQFNTMWNLMQSFPMTDFAARSQIIEMLGCSGSRSLLNEFVRSVFDLSIYIEFEQYSVINSVLQHGGNLGITVVLEFFIDNAVRSMETFGTWFVQSVANHVCTAEHIEKFMEYQSILVSAGLLTQAQFDFNMAMITESLRWSNTQGEVVSEWLMQNF